MNLFLKNTWLITFFIMLSTCYVSKGQEILPSQNQTFQYNQSMFNKFSNDLDNKTLGKFENIPGDYYLNKKWADGYIKTKSNIIIDNIKLRYCVFNNEFNIIKSNDTLALTKTELVDYININDTSYIYTPGVINKKINTYCFQVLCKGKIQLLKNYKCVFIKGNKNVSSFVEPTPDHYEIKSSLFIKRSDSNAIKLPRSKKKILTLIEDKKDQLNNFIQTNQINFNKEVDLIRLFSYYNEI